MDRQEREQLYNTAWKHWGAEMQVDILIEEMAELTHALLRARRNNTFYTYAVSEEMADVLICLEQFEVRMKVFPHTVTEINTYGKGLGSGGSYQSNIFDGQVMQIKEVKLLRLKERLMKSMTEKHCGET